MARSQVGHDHLVVPARRLGHDLACGLTMIECPNSSCRPPTPALATAAAKQRSGSSRPAPTGASGTPAGGAPRSRALHVQARRVVAEHDQLDLLQPSTPPRLRPAPVVADHQAEVQRLAAHRRANHRETQVAHFEEAFLQVLDLPQRVVFRMPGQMHLAVLQHDLAGGCT
jgi:hypothetical protein